MRYSTILISLLFVTLLFAGCSGNTSSSSTDSAAADTVSSASIVSTADAFLKAAGKDGTWIIAVTQDLSVDQNIVVEGEFTKSDHSNPPKQVPAGRKIALYNQDKNRNKTASYTLTAPRLIVRSKNTRIQGGTFKGDVYVEAEGFSVIDATVDGNVYFANQTLKDSLVLDNGGKITGAVELKKL